jgi:DNA-binding beta-propeller fold protein YncE
MKLLVLASIVLTTLPLFAAEVLTANPPVELSGTGRFDFIKIDSANHRLLACHTGNGSLDVIDLATSKLIKSIPTGNAQGVVVDEKGGRYFVSASKPTQLVIIDSAKLEITGIVPLPGSVDVDTYDPATNHVFVCNDEYPEVWVIDPEAKKILATMQMPGGGMEDLGMDSGDKFLFQNLKDANEIAKIDPQDNKVLDHWSTAPAEKPHGLAMVPGTETVLDVGGNGKLVLMSLTDGKVIDSCDVAQHVDEMAYDPGLQRTYCASGGGAPKPSGAPDPGVVITPATLNKPVFNLTALPLISVVSVTPTKLTPLASVPSSPGAHSIAVDPETHTVWIVFAKDNKPYVQSFTAK